MVTLANVSHQITQIINQRHIFVDDQIEDILALGLEVLGLDIAIVSQIRGNEYKVMHYHPLESGLSAGKIFKFAYTYCNITLKQNQLTDIPHMAISEHLRHPCYGVFSLESYIGMPIYLNNSLYGTLSFSSTEPRENFADSEKTLVKEMAKAVTGLLQLG